MKSNLAAGLPEVKRSTKNATLKMNPPNPNKSGFYTAEGECIICNCPPEIAPNLMSFYEDPDGQHTNSTCFFKRQPTNPEEIELAIEAMSSSCVEAIRYGGEDISIIRQLLISASDNCIDALHDHRKDGILKQIDPVIIQKNKTNKNVEQVSVANTLRRLFS